MLIINLSFLCSFKEKSTNFWVDYMVASEYFFTTGMFYFVHITL